ncbi:hypothetical protein DL768_011087 [Monosporascus sp. mg162]|nr:hypothetical protein DL768_011087 [Monosporascus sp. mg162]
MATVPSTSAVIYSGPKDWDKFKDEFKTRAKGYDLWDHIDPDQNVPWPVKPTAPVIASYPKRRVRQTTRATSASSEGTLQVEEIDHTGHPTNTLEMTTEGRQAYNQDFATYTYLDREYKTFRKNSNELMKWVLDSVSPSIKQTCLSPDDDLRGWYAKLQQSGKVYDSRLLMNTKREYEERLKQAPKAAKRFDEWIAKWQEIMAQGQRHGVPETTMPVIWTNQLCTAVAPIMPSWSNSFMLLKRDDIEKGTINYLEVGASLLDHWTMTNPQQSARNVKAAFPNFHGAPADPSDQDDPDQEETKDINDQPRGRTSGRGPKRGSREGSQAGRNSSSNKRKRQESDVQGIRCKACLNPAHTLHQCYYAFANKAPAEFKPNRGVSALVQDRIASD